MSLQENRIPAEPTPMPRVLARPMPTVVLPADIAPFVGRQEELSDLAAVLARPGLRLLTVVGAGGVGKSRLALRLLAEWPQDRRRFQNIHFVALGPVTNPDMVLDAIGAALGVRDGGGVPLADGIRLAIGDREVVLLLDTFEHVMTARSVVTGLLVANPTLTVMVTSRVPLHVYGEQVYRLAPMITTAVVGGVPDAVQLFVERGRAVQGTFALTPENRLVVEDICTRLDGLPLAIELAAARLSVLSPAGLRDRLDPCLPLLSRAPGDVPARQRTQRATIAWSHDLLSEEAQEALYLLAHCRGGFGLSVLEAMLVGQPWVDALEVLESLVDASLVQQDEAKGDMRYRLLDTIREFGLELASEQGLAGGLAAQHARAMLAWMEGMEPRLFERFDLPRWLAEIESELENIRVALDWHEVHDPAGLARLSHALQQFWLRRSMLAEGRKWSQRSLDLMDESPSATRVLALSDLARMMMYQLDDGDAALQAEAYRMAVGLDDQVLQAWVLVGQMTRSLIWNDRVATRQVDQALTVVLPAVAERGSPYLHETMLSVLALGAAQLGDPDRVDRLAVACLALRPARSGIDPVMAICRRAQGNAAHLRGDQSTALRHFQASIQHYAAFGERWTTLVVLAEIAALIEPFAPQTTAVLHGGATRELVLLGLEGPFASHPGHEATRRRAIAAIGQEAWEIGFAEGYTATTAEVVARAVGVEWPPEPIAAPGRKAQTQLGEALTPRELEVLTLLVDGLTDREIGQELGIRYRTTTTFVTRILTKLNVPSRTAAATTAIRLGLVPATTSRTHTPHRD